MSPLAIEMLLHIHCRREPLDTRGGDAQHDTFQMFLREGLIVEARQDDGARIYHSWWRTTERGAVMVDKLCAVALPKVTWI